MTFTEDIHAVVLKFSNEDLLGAEHVKLNALHIVDTAHLLLSLKRTRSKYQDYEKEQKITFTLYQLMEESEKLPEAAIAMESQTFTLTNLADESLEFDVADIVQSWFMDHQSNHGLRIDCNFCHQLGLEFTNDDIYLSVKVESTDNQISMSRRETLSSWSIKTSSHECSEISYKKKPRCCRTSMKVDFRQIPGFEFIQQPKVFDAYMCKGRCPARYNVVNDHSLLQSIMHVKTKHLDSKSRVHRPCCVGTKYQPLDILHVDDRNPTKLKVTHWKNVIVGQCGCA